MENKIYRKVVKRVVMFVAALFLLFPGMSFAQEPTFLIELEDYAISVYDVSGQDCEVIDRDLIDGIDDFIGLDLAICSIVTMDTKGKLTGIERLVLVDLELDPDFLDTQLLVTADLTGKFKRGGNGINKYDSKAKGTGTYLTQKLTWTDKVKKELIEKLEDGEDFTSWNGERKLKYKIKGGDNIKQEIPIVDAISGLDGDAVVGVYAVAGAGFLALEPEFGDIDDLDLDPLNSYSLSVNVNVKSGKNLTKANCKGEIEKGLKINLTIDNAIVAANELLDPLDDLDRICTKISGKVLGQKLKFKK
jgi:hypothetical protein